MITHWEQRFHILYSCDPQNSWKHCYRSRFVLGTRKGAGYFSPYNRYKNRLEPVVEADKLVTVLDSNTDN